MARSHLLKALQPARVVGRRGQGKHGTKTNTRTHGGGGRTKTRTRTHG